MGATSGGGVSPGKKNTMPVDPRTRGGRKQAFDSRGRRDRVSHKRPADLGTPELRAKRAAAVAYCDVDQAVLREVTSYLSVSDHRSRRKLADQLSPAAKALLSQNVDAALSVHPLGAIYARRLTVSAGRQVVTEAGLCAAARYGALHHRVFQSRRTQVSCFFRVYVARTLELHHDLSTHELTKLAAAQVRLDRAESALRAAGNRSRRLVRSMAIFDEWPPIPAGGKHPGTAYDHHMTAILNGLAALERTLL